MLLPIIIFLPDVKKNLYNAVTPASNQGFAQWVWKLIHTNASLLFFLSLIASTAAKIYHFLRCLSANLHEKFIDQYAYEYSYVPAEHQQKHQDFFHKIDKAEEDALFQKLKSDYQDIIIHYFTTDKTLKGKIDKFINAVFCANIPVPQIIEIHMEVIDEFSKQLRLEGRSDETLLDYRLTLIDILAHLCEVYRCSMNK